MSTETLVEETVTVSTDYKTTLPKAARQILDVGVGDKIVIKSKNDKTVVIEKKEQS